MVAKVNVWAAVTKAVRKYNGENLSSFPTTVPHVTNNETLKSINAAGSGTVDLIKADASNIPTAPDGLALGTSLMKTVLVSLTNSEIKNLRATPKTLVAAPGAGKVLQFLSAVLIHDYATAAFDSTGDDDNLAIRFDGETTNLSDTIEANGFLTATIAGDVMTNAVPVKDTIVLKADCENKALVLANTGGHELANGGGTMRVYVTYLVHSTGW